MSATDPIPGQRGWEPGSSSRELARALGSPWLYPVIVVVPLIVLLPTFVALAGTEQDPIDAGPVLLRVVYPALFLVGAAIASWRFDWRIGLGSLLLFSFGFVTAVLRDFDDTAWPHLGIALLAGVIGVFTGLLLRRLLPPAEDRPAGADPAAGDPAAQ